MLDSLIGPKYTFEHLPEPTARRRVSLGLQRAEDAGAMVADKLGILVVEDDALLHGMIEEALTEGGFEVAIAPSGEEAMTLLTGLKGKYVALVTDINLSAKIDGWQVAKHARQIDSKFPVVYMTGASADDWGANGVPNSVLLTKPFAPAQLITAVSQLLNVPPTGTPT
jgi:DNA-binding response OmpR family regulator